MHDINRPSRPVAQKAMPNGRLQRIAGQLETDRAQSAEKDLSRYLDEFPDDTHAMMLMARVLDRSGRTAQAISLLGRCLSLKPDFAAARFVSSHLLVRLHRYRAALSEVEQLLRQDDGDSRYLKLKSDILGKLGEEGQTCDILKRLLAENPRRAEIWIQYGAALRSAGVREESIAAFRRAIECRPSCGWAWGSLADIKGFHFGDAEIQAMQAQLARSDLSVDDRTYLLFALGSAYEDRLDYRQAFECYAKANASSRQRADTGANSIKSRVGRIRTLFSARFLQSRAGSGCKAADPIFVVGRPRSGSSLVEQILSSHSAIEGVGELPYVKDLVQRLVDGEFGLPRTSYPEVLEPLDSPALTGLGESYLESASVHRRTGRPCFVDKMPGNFLHVGMIHLILPNAKIIDVRRNPAATCTSMFKHYLGKSNFLLQELGSIYRDYVALMAHFDRVLPGRIHRVVYEELVADPEMRIRGLVDYLGLPFEEQCLDYHKTERAIRTPSSEQVRRPIFAEAVDHWRHFEPWLAPLTESLGSALTDYPDVPPELN